MLNLWIALAAVVLAASAQNDMSLVLLKDAVADGAMCLDGSPIAYYQRLNSSSTQWVVFFQGGGWCYNLNDCYERSLTTLGSSTTYGPTYSSGGIFSGSASMNPYFYTWNAIHLNYCDGASWTGDATEPVVVNGKTLYFRGKRGLDAVIQSLIGSGMGQATDVVVAGCSAGGLATYFHSDYIASFFPTAIVKAMPVSGFFLNVTNLVGASVYGEQMANVFSFQNSTGGVHPACLAANPTNPAACIFAENTYPYVQTPIFPLNSMYDTWQLSCILTSTISPEACDTFAAWSSCISNPEACNSTQIQTLQSYGKVFLDRFTSAPTFTRSQNGAFIDSCLGHCEAQPYDTHASNSVGDWSGMTIDGVDATTAFGRWYFGLNTSPSNYVDCQLNNQSPYACNPSCGQGL
eukprot:m.794540 g.794540  ORF g.794540 m.794540 type:complete len:405 (-) comp59238_c0_seq16:80-1294(-)